MQDNCPCRNPCELLSPPRPPFYCHFWANQRSGKLLLCRKSSRFLHKLLGGGGEGSISGGWGHQVQRHLKFCCNWFRWISRALLFCRALYTNHLPSQIQPLCTANYYDSHFAHSYTAGWGRGGHRSRKGWSWHMAWVVDGISPSTMLQGNTPVEKRPLLISGKHAQELVSHDFTSMVKSLSDDV